MTNTKIKELTGQDSILLVPFSFDINIIVAYRQSIDDEGTLETYTVVFTEYGDNYCIDIPYSKFNNTYKTFINADKTI
jgi:hypothetical protein